MKKTSFFWRKGLWTLCSLSFLLFIAACLLYLYLASQVPSIDSLKTVQLQVPLRIYTKEGLLIQEYGEKRRIPLSYEQIPQTLVHAVIATEDQRFFEHSGVDVFGLARATVRMIQTGTKSQGGSTITMQVARNYFLNRKKTFLRKFHEIMLAIKIDRELSKEKILELYLNKIYLGNRAYGVGAAAKIYYGKSLDKLDLAQLAMLAGLPQAPSTQNPVINPAAAIKRRDHVLDRLFEEKYINAAQYHNAINQTISAKYYGSNIEVKAPYVAEMIRQSLYQHFGNKAYTKGYSVYTTIKAPLQKAANQAVEDNLLAYDRRHGYRGALTHVELSSLDLSNIKNNIAVSNRFNKIFNAYPTIDDLEPALIINVTAHTAQAFKSNGQIVSIPWQGMEWARPALRNGWMGKALSNAKQVLAVGDIVYLRFKNYWQLTQVPQAEAALVALNPKNGAIEALVGGFNFQKSKFNRATQAYRQPGSSFKPFIYAAALNKGYSLATLINDAPITVEDPSQPDLWRPHNDKLKFNGPTRLKYALTHSLNMVSIRILDDIGIEDAIKFIVNFGFNKANLPHTLSLALGTLVLTPLDLASAYAVFANGGYKIEPFLIDKISDNDARTLLQAKPASVPYTSREKNSDPNLIAPRVIPADVAYLMHTALVDVIKHGTAHDAMVLNRNDIAGKTGTTNQRVDAWFAGYNPNLVVSTWVGFDTPKSLHEYAAELALPLWIDFMKVALYKMPEQKIIQPENIFTLNINPKTGLRSDPNATNTIIEYFRQDEIPNSETLSTPIISTEPDPDTQEYLDEPIN